MAERRQTIIQRAAALRGAEPRTTVAQAAERALRETFGLSDDDGIYGTSEAAEAMGYRGQPEDLDLFDLIATDVGKRIAHVEPAPFRVVFGDTTIEVATKADDAESIVEALADSEAITPVLKRIGDDSYYSAFDAHSWQEMSKETAAEIAEALFEGGVEAAEDRVRELVEEYGSPSPVRDHIREYMMEGGLSGLGGLVDAVVEALEELDPDVDADEVRESFLDAIEDELGDYVAESDDSQPFDVIPSHVRVEVVCLLAPKSGEFHEDELAGDYVGNVCGVGTVVPGPGLLSLFERANLPFAAFVDHMAERTGVRLDAGRGDAALVEWLAGEDYLHKGESALENARSRADAWAAFSPATDANAPAALDPEDMFNVITESSYSGHPVHVSRMDLKKLVTRDWSQPMSIEPYDGYGGKNGGFVGIYNHGNGSGYIELAKAPVTVPAGTENWRVSGKWGYEVDKTFGIVGSYYYAVPTDAPAPAADMDEEAAAAPRM